ncbi:uncharacterized protein HMPREF1541_03654 [Cyphellophora europaea CBS 101466]|uniref:C2H2-type domain-containing protein n=1 Tax=Cyphellophora europaea (strain CBS 101466) TaxID=1220924 RepID=W2S0Y8_CYPE1|nr:uncharacterized protein HMPREF1541_03654 [Cyphellophora europaea CBS 101466]ETN41718.1 hypothetical protein HMPREF1541_03654 [Cyphellophora europaea CBS 101466]
MVEVEAAMLDQSSLSHDLPKSPEDIKTMLDTTSTEPPKKRRRVAKPNAEKKFECKHDGCGKSYSRAEHLYRHQLNHTPKTIFRCDYPDCNRYFVRQDLCIRHRERHTTHGSQLHKRDTFAQSTSQQNPPSVSQQQTAPAGTYRQPEIFAKPTHDPGLSRSNSVYQQESNAFAVPQVQPASTTNQTISPSTASTDLRYHPQTPQLPPSRDPGHTRAGSFGSNPLSPDQKQDVNMWGAAPRRPSYGSANGPSGQIPYTANDARFSGGTTMAAPSPSRAYSASSSSTNQPWPAARQNSDGQIQARSDSNGMMPINGMGGYNMQDFHRGDLSRAQDAAFAAAVTQGLQNARTDMYPYTTLNPMTTVDMTASGYNYPTFGSEEFANPSYGLADDFTAWLFNDAQSGPTEFSPPTFLPSYLDPPVNHAHGPAFLQSPASSDNVKSTLGHPMSVTSILDNTERSQYIMSEEKRRDLLTLMQTQFIERPHDAVKKRKDSVFEGDVDSEGHILSLRMMHTYIGSYWYHQHAQLPILHKPTFSADRTPNLLLLAVIAIGAATLDKAYGTSLTDSAAEFANFILWHLRWEIVRDADFRPPAKLWVFQALLLVEVYEKMYSTRALHERAHIHHDSTLTLMRRGSSLLGRSASDTPPSGRDLDKSHTVNGTVSNSDESWHRWIQTEATRRAAFGAFVLDSIHATMFGHAAKMVAHEMRLPLPCDEGLWTAASPAEAARVQSALHTNGVKPTMFLDGLKKTLNGQRVRTNSFGRTIIMAGLLSVSWHMTQRDLQISSLGPRTANSFGGLDKWKSVLLRAFDNWKRDFDEALAESAPAASSPTIRHVNTLVTATASNGSGSTGSSVHHFLRPVDDENIFESRTVLHHLAHIAAHVDVVDCQVFAGANRLLGRSVTPKDYSIIREKIERWAGKASARDAAFYALKFIAQVIIPPEGLESLQGTGTGPASLGLSRYYGHASPILPQAFEQRMYIARDDFLLNRPWVLYISALVVWCYGFALEGPISPHPKSEDFDSYEKKERDMLDYMTRVAGVRAPDDLEQVTGKNRCLGLLMILKDSFGSTRWELTHEAAGLLGNACLKLRGIEDDGDALVGEIGGKEGWEPNKDLGPGAGTVVNGIGVGWDVIREARRGDVTVANAAKV